MKKYLNLIAFLVITIIVSGCSNSDGDANSKGNSSQDGVLTYLSSQSMASIDPAKYVDESSSHAVINLYDPLLYPKVSENSMEPGPHIATEWEVSKDSMTYSFKIREGVLFSSGNKLTADDVVYSMKRMLSIKQGYSWLWEGILELENVEKVDEFTVNMTLNQPYAPFVSTLSLFFILDSKLVQENKGEGEFGEMGNYGQEFVAENNVGSGPYTIGKWQRGSEMEFARFDDYWKGWKDGQIEKVRYMTITEEATQKTMLRSGEAHMVDQWMSAESQQELVRDENISLPEDPSTQLYHISMNTQKAPLDDKNVRKAISYAFDYKTNNEQILKGAEQARGPVPLLVPGHSEEATMYYKDLEKAKEYLSESIYSGQQLEIEYYYVSDIEEERKTGLLLKNNLMEIGIDVKIIGVPWTQITDITTSAETTPHMIATYDTVKYPHIDSHTYGFYHPSAQGSYRSASWYSNEKVTELLEKARKSTDVIEQEMYYKEVQNIVTEDAASIFIANPTHRLLHRKSMKGYNYVGLIGFDTAFYDFTLE